MGTVNYLLDTHTLLWRANGSPLLSNPAAEAIDDPTNRCLVSAASAWELATKFRLGRLTEAETLLNRYQPTLQQLGLEELAISGQHGLLAGSFDGHHRDPFDRMLAAQALSEGAVLITKDPAFAEFPVRTLW